jgi:hypothetical protein
VRLRRAILALVLWLGVGSSDRARGEERVGEAGVLVAPAAPLAPAAPVLPTAPITSVAPVAPIEPAALVAPVEVVAPVAPVAPIGLVADGAILSPRRLLLSVGAGYANMSYPVEASLRNTLVAGAWNMEAALGLGHELEAGLRLGLRTWGSAALRADEVARGSDTETFGTGLSTLANPELRVRWRVIRWRRIEAGLEDRVVIPWLGETSPTEVLGPWASVHLARVLRVDAGLNGVVTVYSFAGGNVLAPALGTPLRVTASLPWHLYLIAFGTAHVFAATRYTTGTSEITAGAVAGWRAGRCSLGATVEGIDLFAAPVLNGNTERWGLAAGVGCGI